MIVDSSSPFVVAVVCALSLGILFWLRAIQARDTAAAAPVMGSESEHPHSNLRHSLRHADAVAVYFTGIGFANAVIAVFRGAPWWFLITIPTLTFVIYFVAVVLLEQTGAVSHNRRNPRQIDVNPWFAWVVCGTPVCFAVGAIIRGRTGGSSAALRDGVFSVGAWIAGLVLLRLTTRLIARRAA